MHHGSLSLPTARKLQYLRQRIKEAGIPPSKLDENLIIGTWNIREFGKSPRRDDAIHLIAEIMGQFDVLAITELRDNLEDLERVRKLLGPYYKVVFSDYRNDAAGFQERIAYLYDKRAVEFTGLAAEADPMRVKGIDGEYQQVSPDWWRSPYMASFRAGNFDFVMLTAHIRWSGGVRARAKALKQLADWVEERRSSEFLVDRDFIVLGDFNIPSRRSSAYKAITSGSLQIPPALLSVQGTNLTEKATYDQILHSPTRYERFTGKGGVIRFYKESHKELYPDLSLGKFKNQLSDHLPLWLEVDTWIDDELLEKVLLQDE
ncbi:endonuclease/exonuclease/phosphatase family protein [Sansalvadorimonas sp. 2012CJ34-2]|uniref:Endonuclease/exonuclease/phosphatase family protein n=1 Tax=Parendozoicomonas callyspongiae TaxID=2942213 RepID=A0ABT0PI75_9GAMM|nr:endonuclease/exonuclease/phosphatase family protein [Sansalvadorimonas sp. 2012CJ34-2]MCL6271085.1 endonuclease/exonuclease/phosphatase family protein [Sansalvadorimonas sp. 2012CJ34-2]